MKVVTGTRLGPNDDGCAGTTGTCQYSHRTEIDAVQ